MRYKTLFRLALKVIGVVFFLLGIVNLPSYCIQLAATVLAPGTPGAATWLYVAWAVTPVLQIAIGAYLFIGGEWIVDRAIPSNRLYCHECGYMLEGIKGDRCPECDTPFRSPGAPPEDDRAEDGRERVAARSANGS